MNIKIDKILWQEPNEVKRTVERWIKKTKRKKLFHKHERRKQYPTQAEKWSMEWKINWKKYLPNHPWMEWRNPSSKNSKSSKSIENSIVGCYGDQRSYRTSNHIMYIRRIIIFLKKSFARNINNKHEMKKKRERRIKMIHISIMMLGRLSSIVYPQFVYTTFDFAFSIFLLCFYRC